MAFVLALAVASVVALTATAEGSPRKKSGILPLRNGQSQSSSCRIRMNSGSVMWPFANSFRVEKKPPLSR